jgi:DNA-binding transcriptional MocR family regulator
MLYEQVADRLSRAIHSGALRPGDRLPSVRQLSARENVSISTVLQAYVQLESAGLIEARPQSGHYVRLRRPILAAEPQATRPSEKCAPVKVSSLVARIYRAARDPRMIQLGTATVDPALLPTRRLLLELVHAVRRQPAEALSYDMPPGLPALRQQIARRSVDWGCSLAPDDFIVTCGASEALNLCLRAVSRPGDTIAVESPAYYGVLQDIESLGLRALEIPTHPRTGIELDALAAAFERQRIAAVAVSANFSNPLGSCMPDENKERLVQLLARHEVPLIEDDIYGDLHFDSVRPRAARSFDRKGLVLLCGSFSKTLAPGFRVGWVAPGRFREEVELLKFSNTVATATPPQMAIARFLQSGGYDRHLRALRRTLQAQMQGMQSAVAEHFPAGTRMTRPAGGAVLWVELPRPVNALELHARALEAGVSIAPGPLFSARQQRYSNFVRLNCGHPFSDRIAQAVATLGNLARSIAVRAG